MYTISSKPQNYAYRQTDKNINNNPSMTEWSVAIKILWNNRKEEARKEMLQKYYLRAKRTLFIQ